ncbi:MAG: GNAT family N-acetyltransferase [Pseudomonadota bacterium]
MTLRTAVLSDAPSLAAISMEVWIGTYLKRGVSGFFADYALDAFTAPKMAQIIADPNAHVVVSENEEGLDGFIRVSRASPAPVEGCSDVEIATFYVQPRHHGRGIGTRLLEAALTRCRSMHTPSVWLATNAENDPAIAFYLSRGFEHVGETQFRIQDQAYLNNVYRYRF